MKNATLRQAERDRIANELQKGAASVEQEAVESETKPSAAAPVTDEDQGY